MSAWKPVSKRKESVDLIKLSSEAWVLVKGEPIGMDKSKTKQIYTITWDRKDKLCLTDTKGNGKTYICLEPSRRYRFSTKNYDDNNPLEFNSWPFLMVVTFVYQ